MKKKFTLRGHALDVIIFVILVVYIISLVLPLFWGVMTAFKTNRDFIEYPLRLPSPPVLSNFLEVIQTLTMEVKTASGGLRTIYFEGMLLNSALFSLLSALMSTIVPCIVSYLVAKYPYRLSKIIYSIVIVVMILPIVGSLPSEINMLEMLGLYDTFYGFLIMKMNFLGLYFLIFYATFKGMPWEFAESAFVDGASHYTVCFRIMLPLAATTFFSVYLLNFIAYWNDYMSNAMYLPSMPTLAFGMHAKRFTGGIFNKATMQLTTSIMLALPLIILFAVFQKRLMGSMTVGGIKG